MDVGLWYSRDFCFTFCDWQVGCAVWDSGVTTSVSIPNSKMPISPFNIHSISTGTFFFVRVLAMMIILVTVWVFVPKKQL